MLLRDQNIFVAHNCVGIARFSFIRECDRKLIFIFGIVSTAVVAVTFAWELLVVAFLKIIFVGVIQGNQSAKVT